MDRILITGGAGALAKQMTASFEAFGDQVDAPNRSQLDVTDRECIARYFSGKAPYSLAVAAAGLADDRLIARLSEESWQRQLEVNLYGALRIAHFAGQEMLRCGTGHIVFIGSRSATHPSAGQAAYTTAKAALMGATTSLAEEFGPSNIRVNLILPGFLDTPMTAQLSDLRRREILAQHTLNRLNTCTTVAQFLIHLHHQLRHTSGQVFQLDSRPG